jgi:putative addiction module component (TIGR02574 family)
MSADFETVEKEALALSEPERAALIEHLVISLSDPQLDEVQQAWVDEAERRYRRHKEGKREGIPEGEFFDGIRQRFGW